jgi:hypothetical protein
MKFILRFIVLFSCINYIQASGSNINLPTETDLVEYSLPSGWCNITQTELGLTLLPYLQASNSNLGNDVRLIIQKCNTKDTYPWGYVALAEVDRFSGSSQYVVNEQMKGALYLGLADDYLEEVTKNQPELAADYFDMKLSVDAKQLNKSVIIAEDINQITFTTKMNVMIEDVQITEYVLTSSTLGTNHVISTYMYDDESFDGSKKNNLNAVISNAKKVAQLNRKKKGAKIKN